MSDLSRSLPLAGATNFRDLGGYRGADGRALRWRRLFRSDHLGALTEADRARIAGLGITRTFDFRGVDERAATPYRLDGAQQHALPIEPSVVQNLQLDAQQGRALGAAQAVRAMNLTYQAFVRDHQAVYARFLRHLLNDDSPALFHCTAGKDRTGFAAALILSALGVPRDTIIEDFLLTNVHFRRPPGSGHPDLPPEVIEVLWAVREEFLHTALRTVDEEFGGIGPYLARLGLGQAERQTLQGLYLEG